MTRLLQSGEASCWRTSIGRLKACLPPTIFPVSLKGMASLYTDKGHGDDFAVMWDIILSLLRSDWFVECAESCVWLNEDGEEDILSQAGKA